MGNRDFSIEDRKKQFTVLAKEFGIKDSEIDYLIDTLEDMDFFTAPASTKYHGNYPGGLFDHSFAVTKSLQSLTQRLELNWVRPASPFYVGMLHDLCKCDQYVQQEDGSYKFSDDIILPGHGDKSVIYAQNIMSVLTEEEIMCIRWHMGAYETDTKMWNYYGRAIEHYPNVLWTHTADMYASRIVGI